MSLVALYKYLRRIATAFAAAALFGCGGGGSSGSASDGALVPQSTVVEATGLNASVQTQCAEEDNINVPLSAVGQVSSMTLEATHPNYFTAGVADNGAPDFSNCPPDGVSFPFQPAVLKLFDDGEVVVEAVREASYWRPSGMRASVDAGSSVVDTHYVRLYHRIPGTSEYPQFLVIYQDGNVRLIPFPPTGRSLVYFGSSVIIGPAAPSPRPFAEIASIRYLSATKSLEIVYASGSAITLRIVDITRQRAVVQAVGITWASQAPFATFRSMWVSNGKADVDRVSWVDAAGKTNDLPIMLFANGQGAAWLFRRDTLSTHNTSAPDYRIRVP